MVEVHWQQRMGSAANTLVCESKMGTIQCFFPAVCSNRFCFACAIVVAVSGRCACMIVVSNRDHLAL